MPTCRSHSAVFAAAGLIFTSLLHAAPAPNKEYSTVFDPSKFTIQSSTINGRTFRYRAYEEIVYVKHPVEPDYQCLNIYIPVEYYEGKSVGGYSAETAPILFANSVGGYMPGRPGHPGQGFQGGANALLVALSKGLVAAAPGARGRTNINSDKKYTGKAPAAIIDLKAAVRYLRANDTLMPGTAEKIISNGTSAGGALSALLGATGNSPDYEPYLQALGAVEARDDIFATSAYCPITNLDHADAAYEWLFCGVNNYAQGGMPRLPPGARPGEPPMPGGPQGTGVAPPAGLPPGQTTDAPNFPKPSAVPGTLNAAQIQASKALKVLFPAYLNSLGLKTPDGRLLSLDANGNGPFKDYLKALVIASAQVALKTGVHLSKSPWIKIQDGKVIDIDFDPYIRYMQRMKTPLAFDGLDLGTGENSLFGSDAVNAQHFTDFGEQHSTAKGGRADAAIIKLMNPMNYIGSTTATASQYWRIRHGAIDRDTSLAIPAILATRLTNAGKTVDFRLPWGQGHGGDYDLDELFAWIEQVCR